MSSFIQQEVLSIVTFSVGSKPCFVGYNLEGLDAGMGRGECPNYKGVGVVTFLGREGGLLQKNSVKLKVTELPSYSPPNCYDKLQSYKVTKKWGVIKK